MADLKVTLTIENFDEATAKVEKAEKLIGELKDVLHDLRAYDFSKLEVKQETTTSGN